MTNKPKAKRTIKDNQLHKQKIERQKEINKRESLETVESLEYYRKWELISKPRRLKKGHDYNVSDPLGFTNFRTVVEPDIIHDYLDNSKQI